MKPIFALLLLFVGLNSNAQDEIKFNQTTTWNDTKAKAAKEGKLIFMDCYTSWCAPCKWMDKNVFNVADVANFYNQNFINVKIDMEKGEGIELRKQYAVQSFPTFLFINDKGEVIHRTASKMSVEEFLAEGKKAADPTKNLAYLSQKYEEGKRDLPFLLDYCLVLQKSDRNSADKIAKEITDAITAEQLNTEFGWKTIKALARTEKDKLGAHFMANEKAFDQWSTQVERDQLKDRLITSTMYGYINTKNEVAFMAQLPYFKNSDHIDRRKQGLMLEADFYLTLGKVKDYVKLTNSALKKDLKNDAEKLSFLARRAGMAKRGDEVVPAAIQKQAYLLAKRAVQVEPEEYSNQSTFAHICLAMKKKPEALAAAKKSRELADAETSKIQKLAQDLLDKVEAL